MKKLTVVRWLGVGLNMFEIDKQNKEKAKDSLIM